MPEFKLNWFKMGLRGLGETWEWYTFEFEPVFAVHVHNQTKTGKWKWKIFAHNGVKSKGEFDTKEQAIAACLPYLKLELKRALESLKGV